jgi:hypothetical protein
MVFFPMEGHSFLPCVSSVKKASEHTLLSVSMGLWQPISIETEKEEHGVKWQEVPFGLGEVRKGVRE